MLSAFLFCQGVQTREPGGPPFALIGLTESLTIDAEAPLTARAGEPVIAVAPITVFIFWTEGTGSVTQLLEVIMPDGRVRRLNEQRLTFKADGNMNFVMNVVLQVDQSGAYLFRVSLDGQLHSQRRLPIEYRVHN
jgi:hypothetical protein